MVQCKYTAPLRCVTLLKISYAHICLNSVLELRQYHMKIGFFADVQ